jgi:long-chain fatty acid transport protein
MWAIFSERLSALVLILSLSSASVAYGEAFRVLGQGNSGTSQADALPLKPTIRQQLFYNPAGMTQLQGVQFSARTLFVGGHYDYKSPSGEKFRGDVKGEVAIPPPTNADLTSNLDKLGETLGTLMLARFALGFGLNSPFGLVIKWPRNVPFSSVTTFTRLPLVDIKPTLQIWLFRVFCEELFTVKAQRSQRSVNFLIKNSLVERDL